MNYFEDFIGASLMFFSLMSKHSGRQTRTTCEWADAENWAFKRRLEASVSATGRISRLNKAIFSLDNAVVGRIRRCL